MESITDLVTDWYNYDYGYDGGNFQINDGGFGMYDHGNRVSGLNAALNCESFHEAKYRETCMFM